MHGPELPPRARRPAYASRVARRLRSRALRLARRLPRLALLALSRRLVSPAGAAARAGLLLAGLLLAGLLVFALSRLDLSRVWHALLTATPGWIALAFALMALSLVLRSVSWHEALRAALPDTPAGWLAVARATMIGVMASAVFPGRIGEPTRIFVLTRRLSGPSRRLLPIVAGTVFSQTLINLFALAILASITFTSVPLPHGHLSGLLAVLAVPLAICALVLFGPRLLRVGERSRSKRAQQASVTIAQLLHLARRGLVVFVTPRHGLASIAAQLFAWTLQWLACYALVLALSLPVHPALAASAAVLLAVNVSAILPATPSNVGVFQAACLVVLAAYGVGAGPALAYGIILQAVEVLTALALGIPALLGEGLTWRDIRPVRGERTEEALPDERP
ncbi:MAG TPA: lysylphosphatidylglycerol synthase transmembrane domain-containing protein [Solirubrobacteraceae bacterium]|nr:lysylphosphatidylglycerol synthase transmembrane domain-containing protein [Solirubrobacteraceae bacterium]